MAVIKLFFRAGEPYCEMVRNLLTFHKIAFEMIEVSVSEEAQKALVDISGQATVPVLVVDERAYVGFDFVLLKQILGLTNKDDSVEKVF